MLLETTSGLIYQFFISVIKFKIVKQSKNPFRFSQCPLLTRVGQLVIC